MRLIDADKMRENLVWCKSQSSRYDNYWDDVIERLDVQPTVGGWVSVEDRLPGKNGRYLCRYEQDVDGKVCRCTDFGMFDSNIGEKGGWFVEKVAYWMPLPEPPKEEA